MKFMKKVLLSLALLASFAFADGAATFKAKCASCHGANGKQMALGKSDKIGGKSSGEIEEALKGYKSGGRNKHGMGGTMKGMAAGLSDADIKALADYISKL